MFTNDKSFKDNISIGWFECFVSVKMELLILCVIPSYKDNGTNGIESS